jgi:hypothetical protein
MMMIMMMMMLDIHSFEFEQEVDYWHFIGELAADLSLLP